MMQTLTCIFEPLALMALIASGFTMMCSPAIGRQLFKNTLVAIAMFVLGSMLLEAACNVFTKRFVGMALDGLGCSSSSHALLP